MIGAPANAKAHTSLAINLLNYISTILPSLLEYLQAHRQYTLLWFVRPWLETRASAESTYLLQFTAPHVHRLSRHAPSCAFI